MGKNFLQISILCLVLCVSTAHAYWWRFSNFSTKTLLLKLKLVARDNPYYAIVNPDSSAMFDWSMPNPLAGFCFEKIEYAEISNDISQNRNLVDENYHVIDNYDMDNFLKNNDIVLRTVDLQYFASELYRKTVYFAQSLAPKKLIKWFAKQHAKSVCKSRHIAIVENDDGDVSFFTQKS